MAKDQMVHYNTPEVDGKTRCGRRLGRVKWTTDPKDATCNTCNKLVAGTHNLQK